jgi:plastocyanin
MIYRILIASLLVAGSLSAATTIKMKVRHGNLRYDKETINVKPGDKIKLSFYNNDEMQHNVVICKPGTDTNALGMAAVALGVDGLKKQYIPESDEILWYTPLVEPGDTYNLEFTAPKEPGFYPYVCTFPGHFNIMRGIMVVGKPKATADVAWKQYNGKWNKLPEFSKLTPVATGELGSAPISAQPKGQPKSNYGLLFTGKLTAPATGEYLFKLAGDDGVRLLVDGKKVVEHDGLHGMETKVGKIKLTPGTHDFELQFFQQGGGLGLALSMQGPGLPETALTKAAPGKPAGGGGGGGLAIKVKDQIEIYRTGLNFEGKQPYAVCIGFPGGISCAFDADDCALIAVWQDGFVDPGKDWTGRGGNGSTIVGSVFAKFAGNARPAIDGADEKPIFDGYRVGADKVDLHFRVGPHAVVQSLSPIDGGLVSTVSARPGKPEAINWPKPASGSMTAGTAAADGSIRFEVKK